MARRTGFSRSDDLAHDDVLAYALALMRLRDSAHAAGLARLVRACDALAVTVAQLIEHGAAARCEHCDTLTRFAAHARAMVRMPAGIETASLAH
ncbi:MAG: hypothetical protein LDL19_02360 [Thiobacillus sp.]|nr:hypothetical protein [Thiobacillus sp.]